MLTKSKNTPFTHGKYDIDTYFVIAAAVVQYRNGCVSYYFGHGCSNSMDMRGTVFYEKRTDF